MKKKIVIFAGNGCKKEKEKYYYNLAYQTGWLIAQANYITVTGGGPGLMNETLKGAYEAGGETVGVCLAIQGRKQSKYIHKRYIFSSLRQRQNKLISLADAFLSLPGGIGTFNEIFEVLALKRKMDIPATTPLILISSFFKDFQLLMRKIRSEGFTDKSVDSLFDIAATPEEAVMMLKTNL